MNREYCCIQSNQVDYRSARKIYYRNLVTLVQLGWMRDCLETPDDEGIGLTIFLRSLSLRSTSVLIGFCGG